MMQSRQISRRMALKVGAASLALPLVHIRTAGAAGRLSVGLWDHWVPAGDDAMRKLVMHWAEKHKVDVQMDFITTVGNKLLLTAAGEAQAKTGHDVMVFGVWDVHNYRDSLEPLDDVTGGLQHKYGRYDPICEYLAKINGTWRAVPSSPGSQYKPSCGRISFFKQYGLDVQAAYPAKAVHTPESDQWTWDFMLRLARPAQKAGLPFALGLGQTGDSVDWVGALFRSFGAQLVDENGNVTVKSEPVQQVLDYTQKLVPFLPRDVVSYDDASNNRALISGQSALIFNPPSAWAVAKRDNPAVAADCWTFPNPAGPKGRFVPYLPYFWGIWSFAKNKSAAKELLAYLCEREQVEQLCLAVDGYDIPPFESMTDFGIWSQVEPPKGTVYNYPVRPFHNTQRSIAAFPAPPNIAVQIYNRGTMPTMIAKLTQGGQSMEQVLAWAQDEVEGFLR